MSRIKNLESRIKKKAVGTGRILFLTFFILHSSLYILPLLASSALAADDSIKLTLPSYLFDPNKNPSYNLQQTITDLIFAFLAVSAFVGIVYSGIMMITAGGDATKFAAGKKNLIWAIIGIIIVVLAYYIIQFVYQLGGDLVKTTPPSP